MDYAQEYARKLKVKVVHQKSELRGTICHKPIKGKMLFFYPPLLPPSPPRRRTNWRSHLST